MIRCTRLNWTNLHRSGRRSAIDLDPVTTILGPNDSGKTTILALASLALSGPSAGQWGVLGALDYDITVAATFDANGSHFSIARSRIDGKHAIEINGEPQKIQDGQIAIVGKIGKAHSVAIGDLLSLSGTKRLEWLQKSGILPPATRAVEIEVLPDATMDELRFLLGDRAAFQEYVLRSDEPFLFKVGEQLGILDREHEGEIRSLRGALDQYKPPPDDLPPGTVAEWRETIATVDAELLGLEHRRGELEGQAAGRDALRGRQHALERDLAGVRQEAPLVRAVQEAEQRRDQQRARVETLSTTATEWEAKLTALTSTAAEITARIEADLAPLRAGAELLAARTEAEEACQERRDALDVLPDLEQAIRDYVADWEHCDTQACEDPAPLLKIVDEIRNGPPVDDAVSAALAERDHYRALLDERDTHARQTNRSTAEHQVEVRTARERHTAAQGELTKRETEVVRATKARDDAAATRARIQADLARLVEEIEPIDDTEHAAVLSAIESAKARRKVVQATHDRLNDVQAAEAQHLTQEAAYRVAVAHRTRIKGARETVEKAQRAALEAMVSGLMAPASWLAEQVIGFRLELDVRDDDTTLNLVREEDGLVIPYDTASHSQQTIAAVAFYVAVVQRYAEDRRWRVVLLDDLEHVEAPRRSLLLRKLGELVDEELLDQVITACVDDGWNPPVGAAIRLAPRVP